MRILVCAKQVPDTTEIKIHPETGALLREGVPSILNPYDGDALEMAARIRDGGGARVTALAMGPRQAEAALRDCLARGADDAWLLCDPAFGGSDTLATSYILSRAVRALERAGGPFGLILCGRQAVDGDTAQVGPELAEHLGLPQITCATGVTLEGGLLRAERESEYGREVWECALPVLVTATKPPFDPRTPTIKAKLAANRAEIPVLSLAELDADPEKCGLAGSPTRVKKTFAPPRKMGGVLLEGATARESAAKLAEVLDGLGFI